MLRHTLLALLGTLSLTACAAEPSGTAGHPAATAATASAKPAGGKAAPAVGDAAIRAAVAKAVPGMQIDAITDSPIPGYREVALGGRVVYVSNDGRFLMQGTLIRLADRVDVTAASEAVLRRGILAEVGRERRIVFPAKVQRHRVTVFTDIDCGFCRKLHTEIADFNRAGITVEYLFFPRAGLDSESFDKAVSVWCAPDRNRALTDAKADRPVPKRTCSNPIAAEFKLGQKVGVDGTPAVFLDDGFQIGGYLPAKEMLERIEEHEAASREQTPAVAAN